MASIASKKQRALAAKRVAEDTKKGTVRPRALFMNGYTEEEIAKGLPTAACLYGGKNASRLFPQAPQQNKPGFYKDTKENNFVAEKEPELVEEIVDLSGEQRTEITLNVIELMTNNAKLKKGDALEQLDEIMPGHGLEAENKDVVVAALTKAQIEAAE